MRKMDYARYRGCSPANITKLIKAGKLAPPGLRPDGMIEVEQADAMLGLPTPQPQIFEPAAESQGDVAYAASRARREAANAALAQMELETARGKLIDREAAERAFEDRARRLRDHLLMLPSQVAEDCARNSEAHAVEAIILRAIEVALREDVQEDADAA